MQALFFCYFLTDEQQKNVKKMKIVHEKSCSWMEYLRDYKCRKPETMFAGTYRL